MSDDGLAAALSDALDTPVETLEPVAGGDINRAHRARLADGRVVFVKHRAGAPAGTFTDEADGLSWLAAAGAPRVPEVLAVGEEREPRFLALEWVERGGRGPGHDEALGRGLAALHRAGAPGFGWERDNWIGSLRQKNDPLPSWPSFYAERRLGPLARAARDRGLLDAGHTRALARLEDRLEDLAGPPEPPARLHGDLWSGNALTDADGMPVLIDPAVYGGHREVDLAMMHLFGGFSAATFAAYGEAFPLAAGHAERVGLWQLSPLLVHILLFGRSYVDRLERVLRHYVG